VHGYYRNKCSLPEKEDPKTHTWLSNRHQIERYQIDRLTRVSIEQHSTKFSRKISYCNQWTWEGSLCKTILIRQRLSWGNSLPES
jgi:hypothetical protein